MLKQPRNLAVFLSGFALAVSVILGGVAEAARKPSQSCTYSVTSQTTISVSGSGFVPGQGAAIRWQHGGATTFFWVPIQPDGTFSGDSPDGGIGATTRVAASDVGARREVECGS